MVFINIFTVFGLFFCAVLLASCMQIFVFKWKNGDRVLLEWNRKGDATKVRTAAAAAAIEDLSWREEEGRREGRGGLDMP